jgi:nitroimidazol reductase NimA-like FMN-containing flavoprotein (pyridoxamine 5'-phosphate oxidase superfamily)
MGFRDLTGDEIGTVLTSERIVRLAFTANGKLFVVPVFYVWKDGALHGFTTPGRKTRMAESKPQVGFQVDSTVNTGPWEWASVSGQGAFEVITDPAEAMAFAPVLGEKLADAPPWAQQALNERFERMGRLAWRLRPVEMHGRAHGPGESELE